MTEVDLDQRYPSRHILRRCDARKPLFKRALIRRAISSVLALSMALGAVAPLLATAIQPRLALADTPAQAPSDLPPDVAPDAVAVTDPAAIRAKLNDTTIYGRYYDGEDWIEYHLADGRTAYSEKGCTYPGKWWEQDGQVCYAYPNYRGGAPNCFILFVRP